MLPVHVTKYKQTSRTRNMESFIRNRLVFLKLILFQLVGKAFLCLPSFNSIVRRYALVGSGKNLPCVRMKMSALPAK